MSRLSRKETQAHTRQCLMKGAAKLFAQRGMQHASIDDVAGEAGFSKGAFYANFKNKQELFLALLDERFTVRIEQIELVIADDGSARDKSRRAGEDFDRMLASDTEWQRLMLEFTAYAARDEDFREELSTRYRWMRGRVAAALQARWEQAGIEPAIPAEQVAMMTCAMANGVAVERLLEGDAMPDELFGTMLTVLFAGLHALRTEAA